MSLAAGSRLGPYEIVAALGAGGMGEVYRARDTRLDRAIAIKVLPAHLASDPDFRARFDREGRAIGALGHPNICVLHDVGHHSGTDFLVMEYLEGETLADRLKKGPVPLDELLRCGIEIADALHTAHQAGIVHRDLKPSNIMLVRRRGSSGPPVVKLLDFGLARPTGGAGNIAAAVTVTTPLSSVGTVVGTLQYMAPEQLEAKQVDERADVWAFGCVLYEMLTGKRAFEAQSQASVIAAILGPTQALELSKAPAPDELIHLIDTCLQKDPGARWQNIGDVALQLKWIAAHPTRALPLPPAGQLPMTAALTAILVAAVLAVTGWLVVRRDAPTAPTPTIRFGIPAPQGSSISAGDGAIALSPDGRYLAFSATSSGGNDVWLHDLAAATSRRIPQSGYGPVFSPDSASLLFRPRGGLGSWTEAPLKRLTLADGLTATLGEGNTVFGGSWNDQDIILATSVNTAIVRMSAAGGDSTPLTKPQGANHKSAQFLPDQRRFIYVVTRESRSVLWLGSLDDTPHSEIMEVGSPNAVYALPGYILHAKGHVLIAQPVNADTIRPEGAPFAIARDIDRGGVAPMAVSPRGVLAYVRRPSVRLTWFSRTGRASDHVGSSNLVGTGGHAVASDGSRVVVERADVENGNSDIWLIDASLGTESRWAATADRESDAVWSPDGRQIVYTRTSTTTAELLVRDVERDESTRLFARDDSQPFATDWSKDGRFIVFTDWSQRRGIWMIPVATPGTLIQIARAGAVQGRLSPDGRYIAYSSDETGRNEVYVQALPPETSRWLVSSNGGAQPMWRGDGKELFFIANSEVMAAAVRTSPRFSSEAAVPLFRVNVHGAHASVRNQFAVTPDGQRFLVSAIEEDVAPISVIVNWAAALDKR